MKGTKQLAMLIVAAACTLPDAAEGASQQTPATQETPPQETASPAAIDTLVGRVALYPDALLGQILMCAESPFQVRELGEWLAANPELKGSAIQEGAQAEGFDPSFVALSAFPQVVEMMSRDLDWTRQLGEAFMKDRSAVFESIQRLRAQAMALGNLQSTPEQQVVQDTTQSGEQVIIIQPANPQVIYVPQYNPQVVYTTPASITVVVEEDDDSDEAAAAVIGFTTGVILGAWADPYYGPYGWYGGIYMYNDAWDDWYDHREDMWEDWQDHRDEVDPRREERQTDREERRTDRQEGDRRTDRQAGDRATTRQEGTSDRATTRQEGGAERATTRQQGGSERATAQARGGSSPLASYGSRGYSMPETQASRPQSGTRSNAFSGYGSGTASRAASSRGRSSMGGMGRRGGGGRRR
jgi:hypothetical protein